MSRSKDVGTRWESAVRDYLRTRGWPYAERMPSNGATDRGDINLLGVTIECKATRAFTPAEFADETRRETSNAGNTVGAAWIKRRGTTDPGKAYVLLDGETFTHLLKEAGY